MKLSCRRQRRRWRQSKTLSVVWQSDCLSVCLSVCLLAHMSQHLTSSVSADGPRDAQYRSKSRQLLRNERMNELYNKSATIRSNGEEHYARPTCSKQCGRAVATPCQSWVCSTSSTVDEFCWHGWYEKEVAHSRKRLDASTDFVCIDSNRLTEGQHRAKPARSTITAIASLFVFYPLTQHQNVTAAAAAECVSAACDAYWYFYVLFSFVGLENIQRFAIPATSNINS